MPSERMAHRERLWPTRCTRRAAGGGGRRLPRGRGDAEESGQPGYPLLYSLRGYRYCDLLLGGGGTRRCSAGRVRRLRSPNGNKWSSRHRPRPSLPGTGYFGQATWLTARCRRFSEASPRTQKLLLRPRPTWTRRWTACAGQGAGIPASGPAGAGGAAAGDGRPGPRRGRPGRSLVHRDARRDALARGGLPPGIRPAVPGARRKEPARAPGGGAKAMVEEMGYHRRDGEVAALEQETGVRGQESGVRDQEGSGIR